MPRLLVAADSASVVDEVRGALGGRLAGSESTIEVVGSGQEVVPAAIASPPDLVVADLQIGNMGGMAVCMALRLDASAGRVPPVLVLMLLDRQADVHLALRSGADGWLIKPLDALRLRRAATTLLEGGRYREGLPLAAGPVSTGDGQGDAGPTGTVEAPPGDRLTTG